MQRLAAANNWGHTNQSETPWGLDFWAGGPHPGPQITLDLFNFNFNFFVGDQALVIFVQTERGSMTRGTHWYLKTKLPLLLLHCLLSDPNFIQSINSVNTPWTLLPAPLTSQPQCVCKMGSFYMLQNGCRGQPQASWHSLEISYPPLPISPETSPSFCWGRVTWLALLFWRNLAANCLDWFLSSRPLCGGTTTVL